MIETSGDGNALVLCSAVCIRPCVKDRMRVNTVRFTVGGCVDALAIYPSALLYYYCIPPCSGTGPPVTHRCIPDHAKPARSRCP